MTRGEIWWADLGEPKGLAPAFRRPVVVVQSNSFNRSRIGTGIVAVLTSNLALAQAPGNVLVTKRRTGLRADSIVNVSSLVKVDKLALSDPCGAVTADQLRSIDAGLRLVLGL